MSIDSTPVVQSVRELISFVLNSGFERVVVVQPKLPTASLTIALLALRQKCIDQRDLASLVLATFAELPEEKQPLVMLLTDGPKIEVQARAKKPDLVVWVHPVRAIVLGSAITVRTELTQ